MPGDPQRIRWVARIPSIRSTNKYCRVEVVGATIEEEPVALVREARLAVVIAQLPDVVNALHEVFELLGSAAVHVETDGPEARKRLEVALAAAADAIAKMEGRDAAE